MSIIPPPVDPLQAALQVLPSIGTGWQATHEEREYLDFKETPDTALSPDQRRRRNMGEERKRFFASLVETATCLANANGGVIVVGVRDRAPSRTDALAGADPVQYTTDSIRLAIHHGSTPPLTVDVIEHVEDGQRLILVRVPRGAVVHGTSSGVYKHRVADQCLPLGGNELRDLQAARGQYDWSAEPSGLGGEVLSAAALARAVDLLGRAGAQEQAALAESDPIQFLTNCGLIADGELRRAAVLLYGRGDAIARIVPDWGVILTTAEAPGAEGSVLLRRDDASDRSVLLLVDDILTRVSAVASTESIRVGASEVRMVDYPADAVRELVANAFAHRDWEQPGIIEIAHSPDELVVASPGALLPTLHVERLLRETAQRNKLLAQEMARLRIAEGAGLGFDRVWRTLASIGKEPPLITPGPRFTVIVPGGRGDKAFARFVRGATFPEPRLATDLDVLLALSMLRGRRTMTAASLAPVIQRDEGAALRVLRRMQDSDLVEHTKATARHQSPAFRLTQTVRASLRSALSYRIDTIDSDDAKLIRHLKRHGRISNEDVRNYLDCDVPTARNRLTRLRQKKLIDFAPGSPQRGPNVEYVSTDALDQVDESSS